MPGLVYLLSAATSLGCAILLLRGYRRSGVSLLLWSSLFFFWSTADNVFLYVDMVILPDVDLTVWRRIPSLIGAALLLFGLVWNKS
jgi:hypothetical protein